VGGPTVEGVVGLEIGGVGAGGAGLEIGGVGDGGPGLEIGGVGDGGPGLGIGGVGDGGPGLGIGGVGDGGPGLGIGGVGDGGRGGVGIGGQSDDAITVGVTMAGESIVEVKEVVRTIVVTIGTVMQVVKDMETTPKGYQGRKGCKGKQLLRMALCCWVSKTVKRHPWILRFRYIPRGLELILSKTS
jgi:hypothetical protein